MDYTIARKNGGGAIVWSDDQIRYIIDEYTVKDKTLKELSQEFHTQPQSIRNLLRKHNIEITNKKIKNYPRNSNYFSIIDSHDKAYWLGMLYADGTVSKNSNKITLCLKDLDEVEKFKKAIGAINNKITTIIDTRWTKECTTYSFAINDKQMRNDLIRLGVVPNKTYENVSFPSDDIVPLQYKYDFIRGYFDGDGSIYWSKNKNNYIIDFCGHQNFLLELKKFLNKDNLSLYQNKVSKITYNLKICGIKDVIRILSLMYESSTDDTRLNRKYKIVQNLFSSGDYTLEPVSTGCD